MTTRTPSARLTLAGQAHTAEGPLDMSAMYVVHHAFRRDLDLFERVARRTPLEDAEAGGALARRWQQWAVDRAFAGAGPLFRLLHVLTRARFARAEAVASRYR